MATECSQEEVLQFLTDRGGRVKNLELIDYFKCVFPTDPEKKAVIRESFKGFVDNIAFVKIENGVKFVCLRKKYRGVKCVEKDTRDRIKAGETVSEQEDKTALHEKEQPISRSETEMAPSCEQVSSCEITANGAAQQEILPVSGYGTREVLPELSDIVLQSKSSKGIQPFVENNALDMGNTCKSKNNIGRSSHSEGDIGRSSVRPPEIPRIALIEASPLPAQADGAMFTFPRPSGVETVEPADTLGLLGSREKQFSDCESISSGVTPERKDPNVCRADVVTRRRPARESQRSLVSSQPSDDWACDLQSDSLSASGSDSNTPKGSRKTFIELMMNNSPQLRRSLALRNSAHLSARHSDSDTASLVSSVTDDEGASVALDPLEHAWMVSSADGEWEGLFQLLTCEPYLILKKDFVTGFTALHWAAKQGKPELLALIVNFAKQQAVPLNINARSSAGYTPLHMAAMHGHLEVVKLLVGAYDADVEVRDYSGKRACQYLREGVALEVRDIIGAASDDDPESAGHGFGVRWRLSKVLYPNRVPQKPRNHQEGSAAEGAGPARDKLLRRKSSLSKKNLRLQNVRLGTQIVHSKSFRDGQELDVSPGSWLKSRPKSSLFG